MQAIQIGVSSTLLSLIDKGLVDQPVNEILENILDALTTLRQLQSAGARPDSIMGALYAIVDRKMDQHNQHEPVSCKKGCAFCCRMNVDVTPMEAIITLAFAKQRGITIDTDYLRAQAKIPKEMLAFTPGLSACVFLKKDNICGIYPARPLACRKYVVKNPPDQCNGEKYPHGTQDVLIDVEIEVLVSALHNLQNGQIDSLHKILLQMLTGER